MIRVAIVDDQPLIVASFAALVRAQSDMTVVGTAHNGQEALSFAHQADVVVMDIRMPVMDGITATRSLSPSCSVLMLTTFRETDLVLQALSAGAKGFILKDAQPEMLLSAIRALSRHEGFLDPAVTAPILGSVSSRSGQQVGAESADILTPREAEILRLICDGHTNRMIAQQLVIAETTVKTHVTHLLEKTGTTGRVELIIHAFRAGWVH